MQHGKCWTETAKTFFELFYLGYITGFCLKAFGWSFLRVWCWFCKLGDPAPYHMSESRGDSFCMHCFAISPIGLLVEAWASFKNTFWCLNEWIWKPCKFLLISCRYWLGCRGAFEMFTEHVPLAVSAFSSTIRLKQWQAKLLHSHTQKLILFDIAFSDCLSHPSNHALVDPS